jgi:hypothetical protein
VCAFGTLALCVCGRLTLPPACSAGPVLFAVVLCVLSGDKRSLAWPFHREPLAGSLGLHLAIGCLLAAGPVFTTAMAALA